MQDFKHLTNKKRFSASSFLPSRKSASRNAFKRLDEPPPRKKRLRFLLPLIAALLVAYPVLSLLLSGRPAVSSVREEAHSGTLSLRDLDTYGAFRVAAGAFPTARAEGGRLVASLAGGGTVVYAINEEVQERVKDVLARFQVPYGVFVAMEPRSGRILAMVAHSSVLPGWEQQAFYGIYPMASLFKIITATAALEQGKVSPDTVIPFRGGSIRRVPATGATCPSGAPRRWT